MTISISSISTAIAMASLVLLTNTAAAATLDDVRERGQLVCGVSEGLSGFSQTDADGKWHGFDVDFCTAIAAAIFGDGDKVEFVPLAPDERFGALLNSEIDLLSRNSTWTMRRDISLGLDFVAPIYVDGQSFLVPALFGMTSVQQMEGATVCVVGGTTSEVNGPRFFTAAQMDVTFVSYGDRSVARDAYERGDCDALTGDRSALAGERAKMADPNAHILLRDVISKEPLSPVVREGDSQWTDLVRWTLFALINAEELELETSQTERALSFGAPAVEAFGFAPDWLGAVLTSVGTYETMFERHLGTNTPLELGRGLNALWTEGGLLYAPPMQ